MYTYGNLNLVCPMQLCGSFNRVTAALNRFARSPVLFNTKKIVPFMVCRGRVVLCVSEGVKYVFVGCSVIKYFLILDVIYRVRYWSCQRRGDIYMYYLYLNYTRIVQFAPWSMTCLFFLAEKSYLLCKCFLYICENSKSAFIVWFINLR